MEEYPDPIDNGKIAFDYDMGAVVTCNPGYEKLYSDPVEILRCLGNEWKAPQFPCKLGNNFINRIKWAIDFIGKKRIDFHNE